MNIPPPGSSHTKLFNLKTSHQHKGRMLENFAFACRTQNAATLGGVPERSVACVVLGRLLMFFRLSFSVPVLKSWVQFSSKQLKTGGLIMSWVRVKISRTTFGSLLTLSGYSLDDIHYWWMLLWHNDNNISKHVGSGGLINNPDAYMIVSLESMTWSRL